MTQAAAAAPESNSPATDPVTEAACFGLDTDIRQLLLHGHLDYRLSRGQSLGDLIAIDALAHPRDFAELVAIVWTRPTDHAERARDVASRIMARVGDVVEQREIARGAAFIEEMREKYPDDFIDADRAARHGRG